MWKKEKSSSPKNRWFSAGLRTHSHLRSARPGTLAPLPRLLQGRASGQGSQDPGWISCLGGFLIPRTDCLFPEGASSLANNISSGPQLGPLWGEHTRTRLGWGFCRLWSVLLRGRRDPSTQTSPPLPDSAQGPQKTSTTSAANSLLSAGDHKETAFLNGQSVCVQQGRFESPIINERPPRRGKGKSPRWTQTDKRTQVADLQHTAVGHPDRRATSRGEPEPRSVPKGARALRVLGPRGTRRLEERWVFTVRESRREGRENCSDQEQERRSGGRGRRENGDSENVGKERKGGDRSTELVRGKGTLDSKGHGVRGEKKAS
ncbi:hypothetical protein Cadr_000030946 [Camelus dromedarius]|uniref:Uncharacterized protein n=1 Tax=Camelus dromedarius TaxID=9838 RepID=A0A5N4BZP7_CAMDR|nr:hypothetical protein Cadr_000030946 [Camelus dromedarius]